ncbi:unnamed protein product, partial [Linum tenue]
SKSASFASVVEVELFKSLGLNPRQNKSHDHAFVLLILLLPLQGMQSLIGRSTALPKAPAATNFAPFIFFFAPLDT